MTGRKEWFVRIQEPPTYRKVRFADNSSLTAEGVGRVVLRDLDEREIIVEDVLYVPGLKTNLMSLGQLREKGFTMTMENKYLSIFDQNKKVVVQASLSQNRIFRIGMKTLKHQCFTVSDNKVEWLWHQRLCHLNFRDMHKLGKDHLVIGLPSIKIPEEVCRECVQCKQTRGSFMRKLPLKTAEKLGLIHSEVCGPMQIMTPRGNKYFCTFIDEVTR